MDKVCPPRQGQKALAMAHVLPNSVSVIQKRIYLGEQYSLRVQAIQLSQNLRADALRVVQISLLDVPANLGTERRSCVVLAQELARVDVRITAPTEFSLVPV